MNEMRDLLSGRIAAIEERIQAACRRARRERSEVTLVAVTKTVDIQIAALLPELGVPNLAESRPQELWHKAAATGGEVHWHLVGHLQRNKIERTLPIVEWIHSVDSLRLASALEQEAASISRTINILIEVNVSGEASKLGVTPVELPAMLPKLAELKHVHLRGLMTMAPLEDDPERCRPTFAGLRKLRDRYRGTLPTPHSFEQLSMGMTNDFEIAIEEGATMIRIGTALFEGLPQAK